MEDRLKQRVVEALDSIRPYLVVDGGDVKLLSVEDGIVKVELQGACGGCPMSQLTLKMGIEQELKRQIPEIKEVISI